MASAVNITERRRTEEEDHVQQNRRRIRRNLRHPTAVLDYLERPSYCDAAFALDQISKVHFQFVKPFLCLLLILCIGGPFVFPILIHKR